MDNKKIYTFPLGELQSNCYIIPDGNGKAVVIDPASAHGAKSFLETNGLSPSAVIITHGHFDHFAGAAELKRSFGAKVFAPKADLEMFSDPDKCWADFMPYTPYEELKPDVLFSDGETLSVCDTEFKVMAAPGHTAGSCLLICDEMGAIFTGDVIFRGSIGRTDGFSGSDRDMRLSLERIAALEGNYTLYCGHGDASSLDAEKRSNPYLRAYMS